MRAETRKGLSLIAGIFVSEILHLSVTFLVFFPFFLSEGRSVDGGLQSKFLVALSLLYLISLPLSVFLGAFLSGIIYRPPAGVTPKYALFWTPGLYVCIIELFSLMAMPAVLIQIFGCTISFFIPSWLGLKAGVNYKMRRSGIRI